MFQIIAEKNKIIFQQTYLIIKEQGSSQDGGKVNFYIDRTLQKYI